MLESLKNRVAIMGGEGVQATCDFIQNAFDNWGLVVADVPGEGNCGAWALLALLQGQLPSERIDPKTLFSLLTCRDVKPCRKLKKEMTQLREEISDAWFKVADQWEWQTIFEFLCGDEVNKFMNEMKMMQEAEQKSNKPDPAKAETVAACRPAPFGTPAEQNETLLKPKGSMPEHRGDEDTDDDLGAGFRPRHRRGRHRRQCKAIDLSESDKRRRAVRHYLATIQLTWPAFRKVHSRLGLRKGHDASTE